jgi:RNA methyltransferase, TrmH family
MLSKTHLKYIQTLYHKKNRDAQSLFIAEGSKVVMELLQSTTFLCKEIIATENWLLTNSASLAKITTAQILTVQPFELENLSMLSTANEVMAIFQQEQQASFNPMGQITLVLDEIKDPGNFGTIIRIADWFGVKNIVCSHNCVDQYNPKVVQSTMGSIARVNIFYTDVAAWLAEYPSIKTYAAILHGKDVREQGTITEGIILIGNESRGLQPNLQQLATDCITIHKKGGAESLNAAVATGIILSHLA